ncbi:putative uncharacterized protein [Mycolicibacterium fortuitum subsp. acetamidolyticum]|uniref:Uncharacterized protein n=1 Tax=Mycolicibacterium fortuitum subsp. acetamidolyticum TaxID=144550 RepID=A0A100WN64_MYCFO|nr:putative uncharacterized protein [Mycolicibacterium fortuitum subsp. acetamidolyticum]
MNQLEALRETVRLAEEHGMPELPGSDVGLAHLRWMADTAEATSFSDAKLGRWLGWAQCAVVAANVGVTLADMKVLNVKWSLVTAPSSPDSAEASLAHYPWVVWTVELLDPDRLAGDNVAERTAAAATAAAEPYGCVYEYCVDEDALANGTKHYRWYIGVARAEHERRVGNVPAVVAELVVALIGSLPHGVDVDAHWTAAPDTHATRIRNEVDRGYPGVG